MKNLSVTCIGAGVIGSGWAARLLINGINVNVFDEHTQRATIEHDYLLKGLKNISLN